MTLSNDDKERLKGIDEKFTKIHAHRNRIRKMRRDGEFSQENYNSSMEATQRELDDWARIRDSIYEDARIGDASYDRIAPKSIEQRGSFKFEHKIPDLKPIDQTIYLGIIKTIDKERGFGWIARGKDSGDIYFHFSACINKVDGFNTLDIGTKVSFEVEEGSKGQMAVSIKKS